MTDQRTLRERAEYTQNVIRYATDVRTDVERGLLEALFERPVIAVGQCLVFKDSNTPYIAESKRHGVDITNAARLAYEAIHGHVPAGVPFQRICSTKGCLAPDHRTLDPETTFGHHR